MKIQDDFGNYFIIEIYNNNDLLIINSQYSKIKQGFVSKHTTEQKVLVNKCEDFIDCRYKELIRAYQEAFDIYKSAKKQWFMSLFSAALEIDVIISPIFFSSD